MDGISLLTVRVKEKGSLVPMELVAVKVRE
jgi:hypothetical protein